MQSLRGTVATRGILIVIGAVIAIAASAVTAVAVRAGAGGSTQTSVGAGAVAGPRDTITVVGEGTQNATPDNALISLGVSVRRPTAADAMNTANAEMTALLKAIKGQGVLDADIQTTGISIDQDQQYNVIGYRAGNTVNVKIHHIVNVGTVIVAAQKAVGDDIQLSGINLQLSDNTTQLKGARQAAMAAAAARAKEWANLAGRHLGKVLSVSEVIGGGSSSSLCGAGGQCGGLQGAGDGLGRDADGCGDFVAHGRVPQGAGHVKRDGFTRIELRPGGSHVDARRDHHRRGSGGASGSSQGSASDIGRTRVTYCSWLSRSRVRIPSAAPSRARSALCPISPCSTFHETSEVRPSVRSRIRFLASSHVWMRLVCSSMRSPAFSASRTRCIAAGSSCRSQPQAARSMPAGDRTRASVKSRSNPSPSEP